MHGARQRQPAQQEVHPTPLQLLVPGALLVAGETPAAATAATAAAAAAAAASVLLLLRYDAAIHHKVVFKV